MFGLGLMTAIVVAGWALGSASQRPPGECRADEEMRWGNVCVTIPTQPEFDVRREARILRIQAPYGVYADGDRAHELVIDATTGEILEQSLAVDYRGETRAMVDSVRVVRGTPSVWPYIDGPHGHTTRGPVLLQISYVVPDPSIGIAVEPNGLQCLLQSLQPPLAPDPSTDTTTSTDAGSCYTLTVSSARSEMEIEEETGSVVSWSRVAPEDREAFERYASTIELVR
jgi:hypothetical protein